MTKTPTSLLDRLREPFAAEAWEHFVSLYTPLIYTWGRHVGLQQQDASDLVQEVFVKLVQILPTFTYDAHKGGFRRWLRTVTLNTWRDRGKRRGDQALPGNEEALAELEAPPGREAFWEAEYRLHLVHRAMALMQADFEPASWQAFWGQVVLGRPAKDVATELGITQGAAYAAKFRVLGRLRQELTGLLD